MAWWGYVFVCMCVCQSLSRVWLFAISWTVAHQAPLSVEKLEWVAISFSKGSSQPRVQTQVSCTAARFFAIWATREALVYIHFTNICSCEKNHEDFFLYGRASFPFRENFTHSSHLMYILILCKSGCIAYQLKIMREQVSFYPAEISVQLSFCSWLHLSFQNNKSKHVHKERAAH